MPTYDYRCEACGHELEIFHSMKDAPKRKCPGCGANRLKRLVSAAAFHLKGSGWYVTDFRDKNKKKADGKDDKSAATKGSDTSTTAKSTETGTKSSDAGKKSTGKKSAE